jgi:thiazole synthase
MPLGSPIGTNQGVLTAFQVEIIISQARVPVVVDAGIGAPSHAAFAMEMGADAVLVNTAISVAGDPVAMARAFAQAVEAGRTAFVAGMGSRSKQAQASSPLEGTLAADLGFLA